MWRKLLYLILISLLIIAAAGLIFVNTPQFGRTPGGDRLERIRHSPSFTDGEFVPAEPIVSHFEDSTVSVWFKFLFGSRDNLRPPAELPHVIPDFSALDPGEDLVIWLGHSAFFLQLSGHRIIVDPALSGHASPLPFMLRSFAGSDVCTGSTLPDSEVLLITHDHWDHLDYQTLTTLRKKPSYAAAGLGGGEYLEQWGFDPSGIRDLDIGESFAVGDLTVTATPARHFSGRFMAKNPTLPCSYVITTPKRRIFISGDSGYGSHFKQIGTTYGGFDLALMECGQYDRQWPNVHMFPEETLRAAADLKARVIIPSHNSKFVMANHPWDEPLRRLMAHREEFSGRILTPLIGQTVLLDQLPDTYQWWDSPALRADHENPEVHQ